MIEVQLLLLKAGDVELNPGPKKLNMTNLIDDLVTVVDKWYLIGVKLEIKPSVLKVFEQQYNNNSRRCLTEVLQYWLDGNAPTCVKWETIIEVLRSPTIDEAGLAEKIYKDNLQLQQAASECVSQSAATPGACAGAVVVHHSIQLQDPEYLCLVHELKDQRIDYCLESKARLHYESKQIIKKFNRFFVSVRQSLEERQIPIKHVTEILMGFGAFDPVSQHSKTSVFAEDFERLKAAQCMMELMEVVRPYCNFFSYDIIEELVMALGSEEDNMNLFKYIKEFNEYAKRKVYDCPTELSSVTDSGQTVIYVALDETYNDCTLIQLRDLQQKFCRILEISSCAIRLCRIEPGSIKLVFSLLDHLLEDTFPLSEGKQILLLLLKITKLSYCSHSSLPHSEFDSKSLPALKVIERRLQDVHQVTIDDNIDDAASVGTDDSGYASLDSSSMVDLDLDLLEVRNVTPIHPRPPGLISSKGQKGTAKYKCPVCEEKWKMMNSRRTPKTCEGCGETGIQPYDFIPNAKRMFGEFNCSCGRHWSSGYTWIEWDETENNWVENWQRCRDCGKEVYPSSMWPLRFTGGNKIQKPHDISVCHMCQKYGDCRNLKSSKIEEGEWDDSTSVRSEASSVSDTSEDQNLIKATPVNSDEEAIDDLLSSKLKDLHMK